MKIRSLSGKILTAGLILLFTLPLLSQVAVEKSKDKVIIAGIPYYIHIVKKGETAFSISRAYGITVEELTKENPPALYGIKEGQALRVPVRDETAGKPDDITPQQKRDETKFVYHRLQPGETIYYLSRLYGVSENAIVEANPRIDISRLPVNSEIAVPRKEFRTEFQEFAVQDSDYIFHRVMRGETLASIAERYNISLRELRRENRNIRFPQVGDYIRIPVEKKAVIPVIPPSVADTLKIIPEEVHVLRERPAGFTPVKNLKGSFDVAVLLPFYLRENAVRSDIDSAKIVRGKLQYRLVPREEDWIYPGSAGFLEMYEGILLAADTLRSLGIDISIHAFDIRSDTIELTRLIRSGTFDGMDLIIGPVYSYNLSIMAEHARPLGIPVVSPVQLFSNSVLMSNPNLFMANASLVVAQDVLSGKIAEYFDNNLVFIHSDTAGIDPDVRNFKTKIFSALTDRLPWEEIRFKEFIFYSRSAFDNDSINRLSQALSREKENTIVIASEDPPVISETLMEIHSLMKKFRIRVFGYPVLRTLENLEPKYLFDLDLLVYSPFWIDYSKRDVKKFSAGFRQIFLTEPSEMSFAWTGYDITYYFLSGLAIHGADFLSHPEIHNPDLLQTQFDFRRKNINDGFENQRLYPVRYTKEYDIILIPEANQ